MAFFLRTGVLMAAVAMAATAHSAFDYEPFDYTGTTLNGQNGGTGWSGAWFQTGTSQSAQLSNDGASLAYPNTWEPPLVPPTPTGSRVKTGGLTANANSSRLLSQTIPLNVDGTTKYVSALFRKNRPNGENANDNILLEFVDASANRRWGIGIEGTNDRPWLNANGSTTAPIAVVTGETYFLVGKIVSSASGTDTASLWVYAGIGSGYSTQVPILEPTPVVTLTETTGAILDRIRVRIDSGNTVAFPGEVDEIRIGDTWSSVTAVSAVPEPIACVTWIGSLLIGGVVLRRFAA